MSRVLQLALKKKGKKRGVGTIGFLLSKNGDKDGGRIERIVVSGGGRGGGKFHTDTEEQGGASHTAPY